MFNPDSATRHGWFFLLLRRFVLCAGLCLTGVAVQAQGVASNFATRQLIIQLQDDGMRQAASVRPREPVPGLALADGRPLTYVRSLDARSIVVQLPEAMTPAAADALVADLMRNAAVRDVRVDRRMRPALVPNDTSYSNQWYLFEDPAGIRMEAAWNQSTGSAGIVIAVLDSGILPHADLDAARILPGYDFISDPATANDGDGRDASPLDPGDAVVANECGVNDPPANRDSSWHGLSVVGVMAATSDNNADISGIDFAARILPVRVLGKCGGLVSDIVDAIRWAAGLPVAGVPANSTPARVINLSLAGSGVCSPQEQLAINDAVAAGAVVVVAAGNEGLDVSGFSPANCDNVVTVGAIGRDGRIASYMNTGAQVDLVAPGGDGSGVNAEGILTLFNTGTTTAGADALAFIQGTSFTTAQVSAVASVMLAVNNTLSPAVIDLILRSTARVFPDASCNASLCGAGVLDASAALASAVNPPVVASSGSSGGGGGGGGCALQPNRPVDPVLPLGLLAGLMGLVGISRRRR